jgi:hypothetical protein
LSLTIILKETVSDTLLLLQDLIDHELMLTTSVLEQYLGCSRGINMCFIIVVILNPPLGKDNFSNIDGG